MNDEFARTLTQALNAMSGAAGTQADAPDDPSQWMPGNFFKRPAWRWLRAGYMVKTGRRRDPRIDDEWVALARDVIRGRGTRKPSARALRAARDVWEGDPERRGRLEAWLLTDEAHAEIARRLNLPEDVINAFEKVFFDVRVMRHAKDWLLRSAVGYLPFAGFTEPLPMAAWKFAAADGGARALEVMIAATTGGPLPEGSVRDRGWGLAVEEALVRVKTRLMVYTLTALGVEANARVLKAQRQVRAWEKKLCGGSTQYWSILDAMERFLMRLPALARTRPPAHPDPRVTIKSPQPKEGSSDEQGQHDDAGRQARQRQGREHGPNGNNEVGDQGRGN
jgi:hypothetical protein